MSTLSVEAMQELWRKIQDCCEPLPEVVHVPLELVPYIQRDEQGRFAGLDRSDGFVDAYEAEVRRELRASPGGIRALLEREG